MKFLTTLQAMTIVLGPTVVFAANSSASEGNNFLLWLFLGFGALIIIFQTVPGLLLLYSMIKGILMPATKKETEKL